MASRAQDVERDAGAGSGLPLGGRPTETVSGLGLAAAVYGFLTQAGVPTIVSARLDAVGARHGDRWLELPLRRFVSEIRAEAADLGGWPVLMAQRLMADGAGDDCSLEARLILQAIAAHGVQVERLLRQLTAALE
jgi:hypothetical protein